MKWPWVLRSIYDEQSRRLDRATEQTADALRLAERAQGTMETLMKYFAAPPPPIASQVRTALPLAAPKQDDIAEAIELASGADKGLARHLTKWAKQQALDGVKERDIIQSILHWPRATEWDGASDDVPESLW